jgi:hypothetical protein
MLKSYRSQNSGCTHSPNKPKHFKQKLSARNLKVTVFWDMKKKADGGIHTTRDHDNIRSAL